MRVAIVCYYSPPQPAIASHRVLRMTRALVTAGHQVHWVSADPARLPAAGLDDSLSEWIPEGVVQHGIDGQALNAKPAADNLWEKILRNLAWHMPRRFRYPDSFISWSRQLKKRLPGIVRDQQVDAVLMCCSPHNQILALPVLRREFPDLRIYVDYRDLLSGNPWNPRANSRQAQRILELERAMLGHANCLFVNTGRARERFTAEVGAIEGLEVRVMPNAADFEMATAIRSTLPPPDLGAGMHLGFYGTLFPRRRLLPVLQALEVMGASHRQQLRLHVYCDPHASADLLAADLERVEAGVRELVVRHDYLPYAEAQRSMQAMDALILVNGGEADDAVFVPGKLCDYLMARRPVLFVGHPGEASGMVERTTGAAWCHSYGEREAVAATLRALLDGRPADLPVADEFSPGRSFAPLLDLLG